MKRVAVWGSLILALMACSRFDEQEIFETKELVFTATREESDTKTVRVGTDVLWSPGDAISIFFRSGDNGGSKFTAQNTTENVAIAQFKGTINVLSGGGESEDGEFWFWGIYPYSSQNSCDGSSITTVIPTQQTGKAGTFADNTFITMARSKGLNLAFYNICSGVKFTLTRDDIKEVKISGNNGEDIAGKIKAVWDANGKPAITEYIEGAKEVSVTAPGSGTFATGTEYYLVLAPTLFTGGFTMSIKTSDDKLGMFVYENSRQFKRGIFINVSDLDTRVASWVNMVPKNISEDGGEVTLEFPSDLPCHAVIPLEAQSWISVAPESKTVAQQSIGLIIQPNTGLSRSATINVVDNASNIVLSYSVTQESNHEAELAYEREALIVFYNALDGDNWTNNENWCTDKPVEEWYGVYLNNEGFVSSLYLRENNMTGLIPESLSSLIHLEALELRTNNISGGIPGWICNMPSLRRLDLGQNPLGGVIPSTIGSLNNLEYLSITNAALTGNIPESIGNCKKLIILDLSWNQLSGEIPNSITNCQLLEYLNLGYNWYLSGRIPNDIGKLIKLNTLSLGYNSLNGPIPESLFDLSELTLLGLNDNSLSGRIPDKFDKLPNLVDIYLNWNGFTGEIPSSLQTLEHVTALYLSRNKLYGSVPEWITKFIVPGGGLSIHNNLFSGRIPNGIINHTEWPNYWCHIVAGNNFNMDDVVIPAPSFTLVDIEGNQIESEVEYAKSKYIIHFQGGGSCAESLFPMLINLEAEYKDSGLGIILACHEDLFSIQSLIQQYGVTWRTYQQSESNKIRHSDNFNYDEFYPDADIPLITIFDCSTKTVCYCNALTDISKLESFIRDKFEETPTEPVYESVDYSKDGIVRNISSHSGKINIVFMGDGYSDRMIEDGTYDAAVDKAVEAFFAEEPFKSNRSLFNVSSVYVVSKNEGYSENGETALDTFFSDGTTVGGKDGRVIVYGMKVVESDDVDNTLFVVLMNKDAYAGTCYMYYPSNGDYGCGASIAYFPTSSDTDTFNGLVSHEAGGHGFAKLADEYAYEYMGAISDNKIASTRVNEPYGWWKNVDFTSDPVLVKWSQFLADDRYANEGLGCYEGGLTYWSGVWRPTEASIMRYNTGGFNAPSRYAIWYRIGKLAYGENWEGSYEDFVTYDAVNRTPAAIQRRNAQRRNYVEKPLPQLPAPVVVGHSWREELEKGR